MRAAFSISDSLLQNSIMSAIKSNVSEEPNSNHSYECDLARRFGGIARLYGDSALKRLSQAHVCVIGIGRHERIRTNQRYIHAGR